MGYVVLDGEIQSGPIRAGLATRDDFGEYHLMPIR
jgi:hypothetical protein